MYKCHYFGIKELVSKKVYDYFKPRYGEEFIWAFFDEDILKDLDAIRAGWEAYLKIKYPKDKVGIIINNWSYGGNLSQCGLRSNADPMVQAKNYPYCSGHCLAKAFDAHPVNGRIEVFFDFLSDFIAKCNTKKIKRIENIKSTPTWCHFDGFQTINNKLEIFFI